ncbi:HamA C-terminal domain-containing protein [Pandoraea sputorum]
MSIAAKDENPEMHFGRLLGRHYVDARIRKMAVHDAGLPPVVAHFLYPTFKLGQPSVTELVMMLMGEITGFCATKAQRRRAKMMDAEDLYDSKETEELARWAKARFIKARESDSRSGEGGELLLYVLIEHFLKAPLVLSKMRLKTSPDMPVHGADGVHAMWDADGNRLAMVFGESKLHQTFASGMAEAAESIGLLAKNVDGRMENELQLTMGNIDLDGFPQEIQEHLLRFLHPYATEESNSRVDRFALLVGFDFHAYQKIVEKPAAEAEEEFLRLYRKNLKTSLSTAQSHLGTHGISLELVDIFFFPLPDVQAFRDAFDEALYG